MYTGAYYPNDTFGNVTWVKGDKTHLRNNEHWNEGPSFCVRLIVFEMPDDE